MYSDADAAALYDILNTWGPADEFYLSLVLAAPTVLDVGCGTGTLLGRARNGGHGGRLAGIDPDDGMLTRARRRDDIEWHAGRAAQMSFDREFALVTMANNAFQFLAADDDIRASLAAIRAALTEDGRFAFETRNPLARAWDDWNPSNPFDVVDHHGRELRMIYHVTSEVGDVITLTETTATRDDEALRVDAATMRFLNEAALDRFLAEAGFAIAARYGDFAGGPFTATSASIVTVARRI